MLWSSIALHAQNEAPCILKGIVRNEKKEPVEAALVFIQHGRGAVRTNEKGEFLLKTHPGKLVLCVKLLGYDSYEQAMELAPQTKRFVEVLLSTTHRELKEVVVAGKASIERVRESAYNVVAVDASKLQNSSIDLAHALTNVSGVRIRETGGVGSNAEVSLNGFTGKHVKIFIDGVPMQGMGASFGLNNIPINMADRIEVYKGVVPVGLGTDALGGAINVITSTKKKTYADVSYSFGSFNTHRTSLNAGFTTKHGLNIELNAFQNYSDNDYSIYSPVKDLTTGQIDETKMEKIKRFHDRYHNETAILKLGLVNKPYADRVYISLNVGQTYKQLQNGVIQNVVFGKKFTRSSSLMPSLLYYKRNFLLKGLEVNATANYNRNITQNVDTATFLYNWRGEKAYNNGKLGEQSYQDSKYANDNRNATFTGTYRLNDQHSFVLNDVFSSFNRKTTAVGQDATTITATDTMPKRSNKNVLGLSYRLSPSRYWNMTAFVKQFHLSLTGPEQITGKTTYQTVSQSYNAQGYGAAGTVFLADVQLKLSYEKALRLPSDDELFGNEDLEHTSVGLKPENSNNVNINFTYNHVFNKTHMLFADAGFLYRDVKDYIQRVVESASNKYYGTNINFGKVRNWGLNAEVRYAYKELLSVGVNVTYQDIRDKEKYAQTGQESTTYGARMANTPFFFSTGDAALLLKDFLHKNNQLSIGYSNNFIYEFPRYSAANGAVKSDWIPTQFSHDASIAYTMLNGKYNISLECRDLTDARLYDNFSLQKPGRSFSAKVRYIFSK